MLTDGTVVAIDDSALIRFDMDLGTEVHSEELEDEAYDLVEVTLGGKPALAVSLLVSISLPCAHLMENVFDFISIQQCILLRKYISRALFFSQEQKIEFRDVTDLSQIIHTFYTGSLVPALMCATPTGLLVQHKNDEVYWIDCTGAQPRFTGKKMTLETFLDICYVPDETEPILVYSGYTDERKKRFTTACDVGNGTRSWNTSLFWGYQCYY